MQKLNFILFAFTTVFLVGYLIFSGLSTSLDFKIEKALAAREAAREQYEQARANLARSQNKDALLSAASALNLVEVTLANGYVDLRPAELSSAEGLAKKQ